ncbi:MAG: ParB/RepB/Spo0J family partition protein [Akkermansiaceae bacterium]
MGIYKKIAVNRLVACKTNPRKDFEGEALRELTKSVKEHGVLEPIIVRVLPGQAPKLGKDDVLYEIIGGERRWRASKSAKLLIAPCIVMKVGDLQMAEMQMVENIARSNLNPLEESYGVERLVELGSNPSEIAKKLGRGKAWVQLRLGLSELPESARKAVGQRIISLDTAADLISLDNNERDSACQDMLELGEDLNQSQAREILRLRYTEPRARRMHWRAFADKFLKDSAAVSDFQVAALTDCEDVVNYLHTWGEPKGDWVLASAVIGHRSARKEEEGVTWGELANGLGLEGLLVPLGDVFKDNPVVLVDQKRIRQIEAAAREAGEPSTLGARKGSLNSIDSEDVGDIEGAQGVEVTKEAEKPPVMYLATNKLESLDVLEHALAVWEPDWLSADEMSMIAADKGNCQAALVYLLRNLRIEDEAELRFRQWIESTYGVEVAA